MSIRSPNSESNHSLNRSKRCHISVWSYWVSGRNSHDVLLCVVCRRPPEALSDCISLSRRSSSAAFFSSSSCLFSSSAAPLVCSYTHTHTHTHTYKTDINTEGTGVCVSDCWVDYFLHLLTNSLFLLLEWIQSSTAAAAAAGGDVTTTCSQELCLQTSFFPPAAWISPTASHRWKQPPAETLFCPQTQHETSRRVNGFSAFSAGHKHHTCHSLHSVISAWCFLCRPQRIKPETIRRRIFCCQCYLRLRLRVGRRLLCGFHDGGLCVGGGSCSFGRHACRRLRRKHKSIKSMFNGQKWKEMRKWLFLKWWSSDEIQLSETVRTET